MSRVYAGRSVMSSSSTKMRPSVGRSSPAIIRSIVVLPQPDGPRNEISLPGGSSRSTPATAVTSSNRFTSPSSRRPPRTSTVTVLGEDQLGPVLVDPVLQLVVHLVLRLQRDLGTRAGDRLVLLVAHRHRVPLRRGDRPEGEGELLLDIGST